MRPTAEERAKSPRDATRVSRGTLSMPSNCRVPSDQARCLHPASRRLRPERQAAQERSRSAFATSRGTRYISTRRCGATPRGEAALRAKRCVDPYRSTGPGRAVRKLHPDLVVSLRTGFRLREDHFVNPAHTAPRKDRPTSLSTTGLLTTLAERDKGHWQYRSPNGNDAHGDTRLRHYRVTAPKQAGTLSRNQHPHRRMTALSSL
jgi:hypothetical protein